MGLEELINTLRKNEQKQIEDIWQGAKKEADSILKQTDENIKKVCDEHDEELASACQHSVREIFAESKDTARRKKLLACRETDRVLRKSAEKLLPSLRRDDYGQVFAQLVEELPSLQWEKVEVSPADVELAAGFFDKSVVQADDSLSGGFIAYSIDNRIIVDNSFEKRLERLWPQILPHIINCIEKKYEQSKPAERTG